MSGSPSAADWFASIAVAKIEARKARDAKIKLLEHQIPPEGDYRILLLQAGRMAGKTFAGSRWVIEYLRNEKQKAIANIGAPTRDDVRLTCIEGPSGIFTLYKDEFINYNRSDLTLKHKAGGLVRGLGGESPDRFRGPQCGRLWLDEFAILPQETVDNALFGLRLGKDPKALFTTTPRPRSVMKSFLSDPAVMVIRAKSYDNPHVNEDALNYLKKKYGGTRLGRQELEGELIEDSEGALFKRKWIEDARVLQAPKQLSRIAVFIDPAVTATKKSAETGIAVGGVGINGDIYVLASSGVRGSPDEWAKRVFALYDQFDADFIGWETNQGGDLIHETLKNIRPSGWRYETVHAKRGKFLRADPVSLLYEQGKVHHVGVLPELEDQMCNFNPSMKAKTLLDRLDSLVYLVRSLHTGLRKAISLKVEPKSRRETGFREMAGRHRYIGSRIDQNMR